MTELEEQAARVEAAAAAARAAEEASQKAAAELQRHGVAVAGVRSH